IQDPQTSQYVYDNLEKANLLGKQFESVFTLDNGNIPNMHSRSSSYTNHRLPTIFPSDVYKALGQLKNSFSLTSDGIPQFFLKHCRAALAAPLSYIFNISIELGEMPNTWRKSVITPVPKVPKPVFPI